MTSAPIDGLIDWYRDLPLSHRQDIAAFVACAAPGFGALDVWNSPDLPGEFIATIQTLRGDCYYEVGLALTLRSVIEFFIISRRSTRAAWQEVARALEIAENSAPSELITSNLESLDFRAEQWIRSCDKWRILRETSLTDDNLNAYLALR
jgi:hypothetical protein